MQAGAIDRNRISARQTVKLFVLFDAHARARPSPTRAFYARIARNLVKGHVRGKFAFCRATQHNSIDSMSGRCHSAFKRSYDDDDDDNTQIKTGSKTTQQMARKTSARCLWALALISVAATVSLVSASQDIAIDSSEGELAQWRAQPLHGLNKLRADILARLLEQLEEVSRAASDDWQQQQQQQSQEPHKQMRRTAPEDASESQQQQQTQGAAMFSGGQRSARNAHVYLRLPPRFGKRSAAPVALQSQVAAE